MKNTQDSDLAPFFGDLSQSEKFSEINPPLALQNWTDQRLLKVAVEFLVVLCCSIATKRFKGIP